MIIFIGTLHSNLTPHDELVSLMESFSPTKLLVEIIQKDIETNNLDNYPDEMRAVLAWAMEKHLGVYGFDSDINTLKDDTTDNDLRKLDEEQTAITSKHDWKEFNKSEFHKVLETETWQKIVDVTKDQNRNEEMYENIHRHVSGSDTDITVIVTGAGHIPFFMGKFPDAQFPLSI